MTAVGGGSGTRWRPAVAATLAIVVFVFTRVRASLPPYVALHRWLAGIGTPAWLRSLDASALLLLAAWAGARVASGGGAAAALGVLHGFRRGVVFGAIAGLPMLLQAAISHDEVRLDAVVVRGALLAPFVEEVFFRGLLVAVPVRCAHAPFWRTAALSSLLFGAAHVPWGAELSWHHAPTFLVTATGGLWYSWIARASEWSLWPTISLHAAMNSAWLVFTVDGGAVGGLWPNVGRVLTIAVGTALIVRRQRPSERRG